MAPLFERLNKGRPPSTKQAQKPEPAQLLLDWLQRWGKPTITARDIRIYGPRPIRDREVALSSAKVLARDGWLIPLRTHQHDVYKWQIVRRPIAHPVVAA